MLFNESKSQGLLLSYFQVLCRPHEQRLRKFKSKNFMSDERKIKNEIINYSVNRGEHICSSKKWKRTAPIGDWVTPQQRERKWGEQKIQYLFQVVHNSGCWKRITNSEKFSPSQEFQLIPKIVYTPENYKIIRRSINSAEDSSNVIIKNDQNYNADRFKIEIWYNVNNRKGLQNSRNK